MNSCKPILCFCVVVLVFVSVSDLYADHSNEAPYIIGTNKQLFIDNRFVETSYGVSFTVNPPTKTGPVKLSVQPTGYVGVVEHEGTCFMYYRADGGYAVATSKDGITWENPGPGRSLPFPECREGSVFIDPRAEDGYPFKAIFDVKDTALWGLESADKEILTNRTLYLFRSKNGIQWEIIPEVAVPFLCDSQNQCLYDARLDKYVAYLRGFPEQEGSPYLNNRVVARTEMDDLMDMPWPHKRNPERTREADGGFGYIWDEMDIVLGPDDKDPVNTDLYNSNVVLYPYAQDVYFAFPSMFRTYGYGDREIRANSYGRDLRGEFEGDGLFELHVAVSRDGRTFERYRKPYLSPGLIFDGHGINGELDCGLIIMGIGLIRRGDYLYQYYYGARRTHIARDTAEEKGIVGEALMRTVQRIDGIISIDCGSDGGEIVTPPLMFEGNRLILNADCSGLGEIWVELQDINGNAMSGYSLNEAVSIDRNGVAQEIWWQKGPDVESLANKPVRLRIKMRSAKLYSFQFIKR